MLVLFRGYPPSFQAARNLFRPSFPWLLRYAVYGKHRPTFPAIRCFPFFAIGHSPSYRQRKRSLGSARDDDTGRTRFPHTLSLHDARDIHSLHCHFERSEKSFSSPFSHDSFAKPFTGSTVPAFPAIRCFPFLAAKHAPSYRQRKRFFGFASDDDTWDIPLPRKKSPGKSWSFFVSERLICQTARAWCLLLLQYQ